MTAGEAALQEAWEEAGLVGALQREPVGSYVYAKWGAAYHVTVFVMAVREALDEWPERRLRQREWLTLDDVLDRVEEEGLRELLRVALDPYYEPAAAAD